MQDSGKEMQQRNCHVFSTRWQSYYTSSGKKWQL